MVASMPEATQASITAAEAKMLGASEALPEVCSFTPALMKDITPVILDDKRRYKALVKADLVALYLDWQRKYGHTAYQKDMFRRNPLSDSLEPYMRRKSLCRATWGATSPTSPPS